MSEHFRGRDSKYGSSSTKKRAHSITTKRNILKVSDVARLEFDGRIHPEYSTCVECFKSLLNRPYQIWSKLSDQSQTFPKVVSGVPSNTCEILGQLKKSLRWFTSNLWFRPSEGLILHYFWLYLKNRSTYKVAKPLKMCRIAIFSMVYQHSGPVGCTLLEI